MCKDNVLGIEFTFEDIVAMGAACGAMSLIILKGADCPDDFIESAHLASLHERIARAINAAHDMKERAGTAHTDGRVVDVATGDEN